MTRDHLNKAATAVRRTILEQVEHDNFTIEDHVTLALLLSKAAEQQLTHAESLEQQAAA